MRAIDTGRIKRLAVWALFGLAFPGCSGGTTYTYSGPTGTVHGKVTFQGQPVTVGLIAFQSVRGSCSSPIEQDGTYTLSYMGRGEVPVGNYTVFISPPRTTSSASPGSDEGVPATVKHPMIPDMYQGAGTSGLTASVKEGENPPIDFDLK